VRYGSDAERGLMVNYKIICGLSLFLILITENPQVVTAHESGTYQDTYKLLDAMDDVTSDSDKLAELFKVGDERIQDLIHALDDSARISLRAQIVIRYLGNAEGMKRLVEWYGRQPNEYAVAGPVPLPLTEWDYKFINLNLIGKPPKTWGGLGEQYIYALAIDDRQQNKALLEAMIKGAGAVNEETLIGFALRQVRRKHPSRNLLPARKDLAKLILDHAFFVSTQDHKYASARLLGLNGTKDKALVQVYINRGPLAEEWCHVVIKKGEQGWKFFSITQVAQS
jgi:hypothetical protein